MAVTINASTSAGLVQTADTSGILQLQTAGTAAVTIDSSQNVGIGTTSPDYRLVIQDGTAATRLRIVNNNNGVAGSGIYMQVINGSTTVSDCTITSDNSGNIKFFTGTSSGSEKMRIDSSGNVLTGTTTASNSSGVGGKYLASATAPSYSLVGSSSSTDASYVLYSTGAAAYRFYVQYDGKIYATNTTITGISDIRLKENIRDLDEGLDTVLSLKPRKFDWKEGKGKDIKNDRGFIAQEFEEVLPDLIDEWKDTPPEGEKPYKSVRADLIPVLVKAIQEQQTIINDLKARITALEGAK